MVKFLAIIGTILVLSFGFYYADKQGWIDAEQYVPGTEKVDTKTN